VKRQSKERETNFGKTERKRKQNDVETCGLQNSQEKTHMEKAGKFVPTILQNVEKLR
jgi:hypothetical protein